MRLSEVGSNRKLNASPTVNGSVIISVSMMNNNLERFTRRKFQMRDQSSIEVLCMYMSRKAHRI